MGLVVAALLGSTRAAFADEPIARGEPAVMREPSEVVDVIDAFDGDDPIDVVAGLRFELDVEGATLAREAGDTTEARASWSRVTSRLVPMLSVGLYKDFAITAELPLVLSRSSSVDAANASSTALVPGADPVATLPISAPERSGVERLSLGLAKGILNQARDRDFPTWMVAAEARIDVSAPRHACTDAPAEGQVECADPADRNRDGKRDAGEPALEPDLESGIGRGTLEIAIRTAISRRVRFFEPYGMFETTFEVPVGKSPLTDALAASTDAGLPVRGTLSLGMSFIPWENRERFARIAFDTRLLGGFVTRGLETTELFDALGSSPSASLRAPNPSADGDVYESGVTVAAAHGVIGASGAFSWRASQIIRLGVAASLRHRIAYRITDADPSDPSYRPEIDAVGSRFLVEGAYRFTVSAEGAVLF